ncbi:hypothetical protein [Pseudomonas sp. Ga0074129]|uniref:hypothetical protein n=1 Tax=Pseudomonas sp. Ga0074129 TaxID=1752219 RepID=UPI000B0E0A12|nr:hypothetical protein [Pseudomonas sp. Ga0074129]
MTLINFIFVALLSAAFAALLAYRVGLGTGARAQRLNNQALHNQQAKALQNALRSIESLTARLAALLTRQTETAERADHCEAHVNELLAKQQHHQAQLEAIMQDADARIKTYARRANPFNHDDRITLQAAANQLQVAANTYTALHLPDEARFATQMQQRVLNLAERLQTTLAAQEANEQQAAKAAA